MARSTVHSVHYRINADASEFTKGINLTRSETNRLRGTLRSVVTPMEKLELQQKDLQNAIKSSTGDTTQLREALRRVERQMAETEKGGNRLVGFFKDRFRVTLLDITSVLNTVGRLTVGTLKRQFDELDTLAKKAGTVGLGETPEVLKQLQVAGELSGIDDAALTTGLQKFFATIGDVGELPVEAADALKELGLTAEELAGDPARAVFKFADAFSKFNDEAATQANIAKSLFGRTGVDLVNLFREGGAGIQQLTAGIDFSNFNKEALGAIEKANDDILKMQTQATAAMVEHLPEIARFTSQSVIFLQQLAQHFIAGKNFFNRVGEAGGRGVGRILDLTGRTPIDEIERRNRMKELRHLEGMDSALQRMREMNERAQARGQIPAGTF